MRLPIVAIVGRPNVGKSTLFNRIAGKRRAIIHDKPGVTRDRNYAPADWIGHFFRVVDTGGWEAKDLPTSAVSDQMREQAQIAIEEAHVTILMVDVREQNNPVDLDVIDLLRRRHQPFFLAVNRCDTPRIALEAAAFYSYGVEEVFPISAVSGFGTGELLDAVVARLPETADQEPEEDETAPTRVAVVGRPNTGKSTLINKILGKPRLIASPVPGTTRDAIDTPYAREGKNYTFIDTAGIRRRGSIEYGVEKLSAMAAMLSMERCDVALLMIDAEEGITDQDAHIAGYAAEAGCGVIIVVNKWDVVEKDNSTVGAFVKKIKMEWGFLNYAPILFVSALTGQRVVKIFELIDQVAEQHARRIATSDFNRTLARVVERNPPPIRKNRALKIKYGAQVTSRPPTFAVFCNDSDLMHFSYQRYLINQIRLEYGFEGTPIRLSLRSTKREAPKH
ncbi:MAG: ribosome biogenesis GTPase Der [Candidatus Sumerlaeota bacterium]|nr:ribosome biogenesis GTPase Der [Candidatus Sumerlaeota bacterium]